MHTTVAALTPRSKATLFSRTHQEEHGEQEEKRTSAMVYTEKQFMTINSTLLERIYGLSDCEKIHRLHALAFTDSYGLSAIYSILL